MARRIRTIVSNEERSKQQLQDLKTNLQGKHYPGKLIEDGIKRAKISPKKNFEKQKHHKKTTKSILLLSQPIILTTQTSYLQ